MKRFYIKDKKDPDKRELILLIFSTTDKVGFSKYELERMKDLCEKSEVHKDIKSKVEKLIELI